LAKEIKVTMILSQNDPRFVPILPPPYKEKRVHMGFLVMRMTKIEDKVKYYEPTKKVFIKKPANARTVTATFSLQ
jgi:hypothetical protein